MNRSWITRSAVAGAGAAMLVAAAAAPACAHVTVSAPNASRGGSAVLVYRVPNESATDSPTVEFRVRIPGVTTADTEAMPGWTAAVRKNTDDDALYITWTADPGSGIAPGQFGQFAVLANGLPDTGNIVMPAVQTYEDGQVVRWEQEPESGEEELAFPAPVLTLMTKQSDGTADHGDIRSATAEDSADDTAARWLGGIGVALGAVALITAIGFGVRRRP
ncbi:YcnI family protein [Nocardia sp. 004]|uniref:YcnI family protein n=1 Tax=Nocardia sp. 004 TaxID=3385978 RepID=UPI0039A01A6B